jgi:GR25 family glycosyltransferase involved in LPS biosynthesis
MTWLATTICILSGLLILVIIYKIVRKTRTVKKYQQLKDLVENLKIYNDIWQPRCNFPYPIFYINMDKHQERRNYMESQLNRFAKNYTRIPGVDGSKIQNTENDSIQGLKFVNEYPKMSKAEIGCTLSHFLAISEVLKSGKDIAMICEDDIMLEMCGLTPPIEKILENAPPDWEILQLCISGTMDGSLGDIYETYNLKSFSKMKFLERKWPKDVFWSTACYLINRKGAEKIVSAMRTGDAISIRPSSQNPLFPTHGSADTYLLDITRTYSVLPAIFAANNTELESTIHPDHTPSHIQHSLTILSPLKDILSSKQLQFTKTLFDLDDILTHQKQRYFLACGTLLGAIREGKFIDHDEDIDVGILAEEYDPKIEKELVKKFKIIHKLGSVKTGYEISLEHKITKIHLDIFLYYKESNFRWAPSFFGICNKSPRKMCRWEYHFDSLGEIDFLQRKFNIPFPPDKYLEDGYGLDWQTPKKFSYHEGLTGGYKNLIRKDFGKEGTFPENPTVWQYWEEGDYPTPEYIKHCIGRVSEQCKKDNLRHIVLTPDNIHSHLDTSKIPKEWYQVEKKAHKADYIRAVALYTHGGLWLDADVVVRQSFRPFFENLNSSDWVVFENPKKEFSISVIASRQKSPLMNEWIKRMNPKLRSKKLEWTEIGYDILYPLRNEWEKTNKGLWRVKVYSDRTTCYPLYWDKWEVFFSEGGSEFLDREFQPVVVLYNAMFPEWFKRMSVSDFQSFLETSPTVLANLLRG